MLLKLECVHLNPVKNADSESAGPGYSPMFCISNTVLVTSTLLVYGPRFEQQGSKAAR